jgi:NitT/TauT family transport system substrate-binding protein
MKDMALGTVSIPALLLVVVLTALGCGPGAQREPQTAPLELVLAFQPATYSGLIAIAEEKGYFKKAGVDVFMRPYPSGLSALEAVCRGEAQIATVADIAFAGKMLEEPSLRVVASIGLSVGSRIVARKDRDILEPSDLNGKRIGYSPNTASDYFLDAFLLTNNISPADITAVPIPPARQAEALVTGEIDAVSAFDIYAFEAEERLGGNGVSWKSQNSLSYHWLLATRESLTLSPEVLKRFLRGLLEAENFLLAHEDEAKSIIIKEWGFNPELVRQTWDQTRLNVSFNQSVITALQNFARWKMRKAGEMGDPPTVLNFIYTGALDEIDPRVVTIFR